MSDESRETIAEIAREMKDALCGLLEHPPLLKCEISKNECGTDTWMDGRDCPCQTCQAYLRIMEWAARLEATAEPERAPAPAEVYIGLEPEQLGVRQPITGVYARRCDAPGAMVGPFRVIGAAPAPEKPAEVWGTLGPNGFVLQAFVTKEQAEAYIADHGDAQSWTVESITVIGAPEPPSNPDAEARVLLLERGLISQVDDIHAALPDLARESDLDDIPRWDARLAHAGESINRLTDATAEITRSIDDLQARLERLEQENNDG